VFRQTEHLARPGINEALLISDGFHIGYNATAPTFAGVPAADLQAVIGEAKTVLKALYLGACLLNGVAGLTAAQGVHPGTLECVEVGGNIFTNNDALTGTTLKATVAAQAQTYADVLFDLFIPDVMRLDTGIATSTYLSPCSPTVVPTGKGAGLCGGRFLRDDVIDITYDFLLNGAGTCARPAGTNCATANQVSALVGDGVSFDNAVAGNNVDQRIPGDPNNRQQGHPAVTNTFPYSAPPI
jgi:hypothetical protein